MSTRPTDADTGPAMTPRERTDGAQLMFATDCEVPISGLFECESSDTLF